MMDDPKYLPALKAFVCVARHGDLAHCSTQLKLSPDEILEQLDQLQLTLACSLFTQQSPPFHLSQAGLAMVEQAELIVHRYQELQRHCQHLQQGQSLQLSISYQSWFPSPWLTLLASQLHRYDHLLELNFTAGQQQMMHFSFSANNQRPEIEVLDWQAAKLVKVAHPKLVNHSQLFDSHLKLFDIREPQHNNLFSGETLLLDALSEGLGWAILPQISVESRLAEGTLKAWLEPQGELATYLHLSKHCPEDLCAWIKQQQAEYLS
ncbi:LysR family transcriptional regulator [Agarivorans sp. MS3-6]|uniref:LysR family transcriptional regulator n=1 Tax=Agarivorans sp. TSD2052 TaxID=2937286 RepID=UPI00200BE573|nr:LysR family transcriptional regulator [Agarivorans sp. TSD2052]UPW18449.1 LysR family transcriptional regulator [Agarivorans sp. TSD2052]